MDISKLLKITEDDKNKLITFAGTDYGLRVMSTTVPVTPERAQFHLDQYHKTESNNTSSLPSNDMLYLPDAVRIIAQQLDEISGARGIRRKRERRKRVPYNAS